jgi:hypothetical protein
MSDKRQRKRKEGEEGMTKAFEWPFHSFPDPCKLSAVGDNGHMR